MAATINTNIASINAQRNLALSGQSLNTTMQRLSSGLRVNSAKDDAAGLAIAERMNTQVKGLTVAARNANDGISLAQTAEGALGKVGDMLQRMRELAVQASNATNSDSDRAALQAEVSQLAAEIDRVAKQTNFNGQKILDGSFAGAVFQVGANSGDNVTLGALADTRSSKISTINYAENKLTFNVDDTDPLNPAIADFDQVISAGTLKIQVGDLPAVELSEIDPANSSLERIGQVITAINNKTTDTGVTAYMTLKEGTQEYSIAFMSSKVDGEGEPLPIKFSGFTLATTGLQGLPEKIETTGANTDADLKNLETLSAATGYSETKFMEAYNAFLSKHSGLAKADGLTVATAAADDTAATAAFNNLTTAIGKYNDLSTAAAAYEASNKDFAATNAYAAAIRTYTGGTAPADAANDSTADIAGAQAAISSALTAAEFPNGELNIGETNSKINQRGVDDIDVTTQAGAWIALKKIDSAIDQINGARATLGAMQTRFETAVNNIDIQVENLSAARGRIVDADFAVETANLSRTQILQQAGTAMVAQANQIPQNVLQLLQG